MAALVPLGNSQAAEPGAEEQLVPVGEAAANPKAKAKGRPTTNPKGRIDIDERIDAARATVRAAAKAMGAARALSRLEKKEEQIDTQSIPIEFRGFGKNCGFEKDRPVGSGAH